MKGRGVSDQQQADPGMPLSGVFACNNVARQNVVWRQ